MSHLQGTVEPGWQTRPLCCRYLAVLFEVLPVQVRVGGVVHDRVAQWALGVLADGPREVLGAWLEPVPTVTGQEEVFEDLKVRGVEKIRFVSSNEPADVSESMLRAYPAAKVLPSIGHLLQLSLAQVAPRHRRYGANVLGLLGAAATAQAARAALTELAASRWGATYPSVVERWRAAVEELEPFYALTPSLQRIICSGDEAVQRLHRSLGLAVARQGSFADPAEATSFMVGALERAERSLVARGTVREACIEHRAGSANRASSRSRVEALGL